MPQRRAATLPGAPPKTRLPSRGKRVWAQVWEGPPCRRAAEPEGRGSQAAKPQETGKLLVRKAHALDSRAAPTRAERPSARNGASTAGQFIKKGISRAITKPCYRHINHFLKKKTSLAVQWLRLHTSNAGPWV